MCSSRRDEALTNPDFVIRIVKWSTLPVRAGAKRREHPQGQPPPGRGRAQVAHGAARAEGTAGDGAPPQRPRHPGMEAVPERMKQREGECQSSLSRIKLVIRVTHRL